MLAPEFYSYLKVGITVVWPSEKIAQAGRPVLYHHGYRRMHSAKAQHQWNVTFSLDEVPSRLPAISSIVRHPSGLSFYETRKGVRLQRRNDMATIQASSNTITMNLPSLRFLKSGDDHKTLFLFLTFSLLIIMQYAHFFGLHGAALVYRNSCALIIGPSDCGKSTLSMHLVRSGWLYLSDDSIMLWKQEGDIEVSPFRNDFVLDPDAATLFPEIMKHPEPSISDPSKWSIQIEELYPHQSLLRAKPQVLLFPKIEDRSDSQLQRIGRAEALTRLVAQVSFLNVNQSLSTEQLDVVNHLVQQTTPYQIAAGRDIKTSSDAAHRLVSTVVSQ